MNFSKVLRHGYIFGSMKKARHSSGNVSKYCFRTCSKKIFRNISCRYFSSNIFLKNSFRKFRGYYQSFLQGFFRKFTQSFYCELHEGVLQEPPQEFLLILPRFLSGIPPVYPSTSSPKNFKEFPQGLPSGTPSMIWHLSKGFLRHFNKDFLWNYSMKFFKDCFWTSLKNPSRNLPKIYSGITYKDFQELQQCFQKSSPRDFKFYRKFLQRFFFSRNN